MIPQELRRMRKELGAQKWVPMFPIILKEMEHSLNFGLINS